MIAEERKVPVTALIVLPGRPRTKKNSQRIIINQRTGRKQVIQSKAYEAYETDCLNEIKFRYRGPRFSGPVWVQARYWMPDKTRPDLINLLQATCDILEKAHVIRNDQDIVRLDGSEIVGIDKENPRVEITITEEVGIGEGIEWRLNITKPLKSRRSRLS